MGHLITVEGGEFTGKTSVVVPTLYAVCQALGIPTLKSREPGGTPEAEVIRQLIFEKLRKGAKPKELALLFNKARKVHLDSIVHPFLHSHPEGVVILDRYCDSTFVYQGAEAGVPIQTLLSFHEKYAGNYFPDFTILLHFPRGVFEKTILERSQNNSENGRDKTVWDESDMKTHRTRQKHYLSLPKMFKDMNIPRVFAKVDASRDKSLVQEHVSRKLLNFLKKIRRGVRLS